MNLKDVLDALTFTWVLYLKTYEAAVDEDMSLMLFLFICASMNSVFFVLLTRSSICSWCLSFCVAFTRGLTCAEELERNRDNVGILDHLQDSKPHPICKMFSSKEEVTAFKHQVKSVQVPMGLFFQTHFFSIFAKRLFPTLCAVQLWVRSSSQIKPDNLSHVSIDAGFWLDIKVCEFVALHSSRSLPPASFQTATFHNSCFLVYFGHRRLSHDSAVVWTYL